jgi:hypothetical protein
MQTYWQNLCMFPHTFFTSVLDGSEWSASCPCCITYIGRRLDRPKSWCGQSGNTCSILRMWWRL